MIDEQLHYQLFCMRHAHERLPWGAGYRVSCILEGGIKMYDPSTL
jgi:hypothetical protein